jgi:protein required for attachment to host cells
MTKSVMKPRRKARLPVAPPLDSRRRRTLIVVADGARARFFEPSDNGRTLVPARRADMYAPKSRRPTYDIVSDRAGRGTNTGAGTQRHAFEAPHDYRKLEKHNFTAELAHVLANDYADRRFDRLVLVAPPRTLGELRELLSPQVGKLVEHEVAKDLTASTPASIRKALGDALPTPVVARA